MHVLPMITLLMFVDLFLTLKLSPLWPHSGQADKRVYAYFFGADNNFKFHKSPAKV